MGEFAQMIEGLMGSIIPAAHNQGVRTTGQGGTPISAPPPMEGGVASQPQGNPFFAYANMGGSGQPAMGNPFMSNPFSGGGFGNPFSALMALGSLFNPGHDMGAMPTSFLPQNSPAANTPNTAMMVAPYHAPIIDPIFGGASAPPGSEKTTLPVPRGVTPVRSPQPTDGGGDGTNPFVTGGFRMGGGGRMMM